MKFTHINPVGLLSLMALPAALWAFFAEMAVVTLVILVATFLSGSSAGTTALAVKCGFLTAYICFTAVLTVREWREWKELDDE